MAEGTQINKLYQAIWMGGVDKPPVKEHQIIETRQVEGHTVFVINDRGREVLIYEVFANRHPSEFYFTYEEAVAYAIAMMEAVVRHSEEKVAQKRREIASQEANIVRYQKRIEKARKLLQED